ncbi:hypothetical protein BDK51DRAFT_34912, partial [Blyttiomyces helicus]
MNKTASVLVLAISSAASIAAQGNGPPLMPAAFPSSDETVEITGAFLQDPLVQTAWKHVQSVVPADILAIKVATYDPNNPAAPKYNDDVHKACYWPAVNGDGSACGGATANYPADITACPAPNTWGLTYDDGPTVNVVNGVNVGDTVEIRSHLNALGLKATLFIVGANAIQNPEQIVTSFNRGDQIAVHTWTHHPMTSMTNEQVVAELKYTEAFLYKTIKKVPTMWRPPYGDVDNRVRAIASALGYETVFWTTSPNRDSTDADQADNAGQSVADGIVKTIETWFQPGPGFIELEHDIDPFTSGIAVKALEAVQAQGANFPLKIMPVGTCVNKPFYRDGTSGPGANGSTGALATTTLAAANGTATAITITNSTATLTSTIGTANLAATATAGAAVSVSPLSSAAPISASTTSSVPATSATTS